MNCFPHMILIRRIMQAGERITLWSVYRPHISQRMHHGNISKEIGFLKDSRYTAFIGCPQIEIRPPAIPFVQKCTIHDPTGERHFQRTIIKTVQDRMGHTGKVTLVARHLYFFQRGIKCIVGIGYLLAADQSLTGIMCRRCHKFIHIRICR